MLQLPPPFESEMRATLGDDYNAFRESLESDSPVSIRINTRKAITEAYLSKVPWSAFGHYLPIRPSFTLDPLFHAGAYYVQEASSMFLEQALMQHAQLDKSLRVLDLSAAPGGKSTHLLSLLKSSSLLVSNEVIRSRASILAENITKWGASNVLITNNDPSDFSALSNFFDVIVVDAPCSGEGLFRKDPDAMQQWSPDNVALCAARQKRILADIWPALKENGLLVYSTCTYNKFENEDNLQWLKNQYDAEFLEIRTENDWNILESSQHGIKGYRFFSHKVTGEGFFIAAVRKTTASESINIRSKKKLQSLPQKITNSVSPWLRENESLDFFQHEAFIYILQGNVVSDAELLLQHLKLVQLGTTIATTKHDKIIPEHGLAMSTLLNKQNVVTHEISIHQAIQFLRRETFEMELGEKGFHLITFNDIPLGWINSLGNRFNNLYPVEWRIRMSNVSEASSLPLRSAY